MLSLVNVTTADGYTTANTIEIDEIVRVNFQTFNAGILYQLGLQQYGHASWGQETFLAPGKYSFDRATNGVRIRSAVAGVPAQVTVDALTNADLFGSA